MTTTLLTPTFNVNYLTFLLIAIGVPFIIKSRLDIKYLEKRMKTMHIQISGIGHDLKNKITSIQLYTQIMQREHPNQSRKILLEIEKIIEIIENLTLDVVSEDNKLRLKKEAFDFIQFLEGIIDIKKNLYSDHKIVFKTSLKKAPIVADKIALDRIVQNLIQNAVKYSPTNTTVMIILKRFNHSYRLAISDEGCGISEGQEEKIFKAYEQIGRNEGMGLGLHIVKTLVEEHNGRIYFESEVGKGTTFYVELPKDTKD